MSWKRVSLITTGAIILASTFSGCGDDSTSGGSSSSSTYSYAGPGSQWSLSRSGTSYTINMTDGSDTLEVETSSETLSTGHLKLTVTDATAGGSATAPNNGDVAHAVEVPGAAFLLKPMEANAETITMVKSGSCPSSDFTANWVIGKRTTSAGSITDASKDWYGSITFDVSAGSATFPAYSALELPSTASAGGSTSFGTCSNGKIEWTQSCNSNTRDNEIYFTESGLMIVATCKDEPGDESHIIAIPQETISSVSDIYADYAGFVFDQTNDDTYAAVATIAAGSGNNSTVSITIKTGNDLDSDGSSYTATFDHTSTLNSPTDGFFRATFSSCANGGENDYDGTCDVACTVAQDVASSGKDMFYCIAQDPADEDKRLTLLFVEK